MAQGDFKPLFGEMAKYLRVIATNTCATGGGGAGTATAALQTAGNTSLTSIATNTSNTNTNAGTIATNTGNTATNTASILTNTGSIATNTSNTASNTASILTSSATSATNSATIVTNTGNTASNTSTVATNTGTIATNTGTIATNSSTSATNSSTLVTNTGTSATNSATIVTNTGNTATSTATSATNTTSLNTKLPSQGLAAAASSLPVAVSNETASGSITTQNLVPAGVATASSAVEITLAGASTLGVQVTGTYTGALSAQATIDGTNWVTLSNTTAIKNWNTGTQGATIASAQTSIYTIAVAGYLKARITGLAAMTGTAVVTLRAIQAVQHVSFADSTYICGGNSNSLGKIEDVASNSGDTGIFIMGIRRDALVTSSNANGDYNEIALDQWGSVQVKSYEKQAKTYSATHNVTVGTTATDVFYLPGNATTGVYITRIILSGTVTTAGVFDIQVIKRSTANSGGTSTAATSVVHFSTDGAANSALLGYTANPTPGTAVGTVRRMYVPIGTTTSTLAPTSIDFGDKGKQIFLTGTAQGLAVALSGGTTPPGLVLSITIEWIEI